MLQFGQHLKILATSRERLNLAGEVTYPVPALAMPEPKQSITPAALGQYEAVQLFIDRAVAAQPAFQVTDQNAVVIAGICQRVDGIPLASSSPRHAYAPFPWRRSPNACRPVPVADAWRPTARRTGKPYAP